MYNWLNNLNWNVGFIESGNAYTEAVIDFYNLLCMLLILVSFLIVYWLAYILTNNTFKKYVPLYIYNLTLYNLTVFGKLKKLIIAFWSKFLVNTSFNYNNIGDVKDYPVLEASWTIVPIGFVSTVTYPSIGLEYGISPDITPTVIVKVIAHQWFWTLDIRTIEVPGLSSLNLVENPSIDDYSMGSLIDNLISLEHFVIHNPYYALDLKFLSALFEDYTISESIKLGFFKLYFTEFFKMHGSSNVIVDTDFINSDIYNLTKSQSYQYDADYKVFMEELENLDYTVLEKSIDLYLVQSNNNFYRMLSIDSRVILPINTPIKLIVTSADVLHSFALPSLGLKIDAVPGRLSEQIIVVERPGLYWGQCSELCGPYHGFMPIVFEFATLELYINFMNER